jgi:hypothetical protein
MLYKTNYMVYSPSGEANRSQCSEEIPYILCNLKVHTHIHMCPPHIACVRVYARARVCVCVCVCVCVRAHIISIYLYGYRNFVIYIAIRGFISINNLYSRTSQTEK